MHNANLKENTEDHLKSSEYKGRFTDMCTTRQSLKWINHASALMIQREANLCSLIFPLTCRKIFSIIYRAHPLTRVAAIPRTFLMVRLSKAASQSRARALLLLLLPSWMTGFLPDWLHDQLPVYLTDGLTPFLPTWLSVCLPISVTDSLHNEMTEWLPTSETH